MLSHLLDWAHHFFGTDRKTVFRRTMIGLGYLLAILLHAMSNFLVSLPDILPGNPRTLGDLFHAPPGSPLQYFALLLFPTLFYVVGGFIVLTTLFLRKENMQEHGRLVQADAFVLEEN
jgi:hypothetical protein